MDNIAILVACFVFLKEINRGRGMIINIKLGFVFLSSYQHRYLNEGFAGGGGQKKKSKKSQQLSSLGLVGQRLDEMREE